MSSIFSKIIAREIPGNIIYEDDVVVAFLDINPVNPGHTLVVPKQEKPNVLESSEEDIAHVLKVGRMLAAAIVRAVGADGFHFSFNTGEAAGQTVFHTHMHIIPRHNEDGFMQWPQRHAEPNELSDVAEKIKAAL